MQCINNFRQDNVNNYTERSYAENQPYYVNKPIGSSSFFQAIEEQLPAVFTRQTASKALGGLISPKTLSNLDALGEGPSARVKLGKRVGYEKESFMTWLRTRLYQQ